MRRLQTRKHSATCWAKFCASTQTAPSLPTILSSTRFRQQSLDLGFRFAQSIHVRISTRHGPTVHQRRRPGHVGRNQRRHCRVELWLDHNSEGPTTNPAFRSPLFSYGHGIGATTGCAIAGGAFYNPNIARFPPSFTGKYFFADLCSDWIRVFDPPPGQRPALRPGFRRRWI